MIQYSLGAGGHEICLTSCSWHHLNMSPQEKENSVKKNRRLSVMLDNRWVTLATKEKYEWPQIAFLVMVKK
jgi:hypothetical protein